MKSLHLFMIFSIFSFPVVFADFSVWASRSGVFTVGLPSLFTIYVENMDSPDSYVISYSVSCQNPLTGQDLSHLISVHLVSDEIMNVDTGKIGNTQGSIKLLGPIEDYSAAKVTFSVVSQRTGVSKQTSLIISSGGPHGFQRTLPEFGTIGLLGILFFSSLIIFYSSRF